MSFNDNLKVAIITGASSGIGRSIGLYLHDKKYLVYSLSRSEKEDKKIKYLKCNISDFTDVEKAIDSIYKSHNRIDLIINNSGFSINSPIECLDINEYQTLLRVNVEAALFISNISKKYLKNTKGKIINIGSITSEVYIPFEVQYCLSKKILKILTMSLFNNFKKENVGICNLVVGKTKTSFDNHRLINTKNITPYDHYFNNFNNNIKKTAKYGSNPINVAKAIYKISKSKKTQIQKIVGIKTKLIYCFLKVIPTKLINNLNFYFFVKKK